MIEFNKCPDCGAEMAAEDEKCPVCGAAAPEISDGSGFSGSAGNAGTGAFEPQQPPRPKKSAFAPATGGAFAGGGSRQPDYQVVYKPPLSSGTIFLMGFFGVLGLVLSFCASGIAAFLFMVSNSGWHGGGANWMPEHSATVFGVSFVAVSCLVGSCIGYNTGAYIAVAAGSARSQPGFVSIYSMIIAYAAAVIAGFAGALAVWALDPPPSSYGFFAFAGVLAGLSSGIYAMLTVSRREDRA